MLGLGLTSFCALSSLFLACCAPPVSSARPAHAAPPMAATAPLTAASVSIMPRRFLTSGGWACAINELGELFCWLLTDESPSPIRVVDRRPSMSRVLGLGPIAELDGKDNYVCARESAGAVHCWGCLLGGTDCVLWPARVALPEAARAVAVGTDGACALTERGAVWCWGLSSAAPTQVDALRDVVQLSATALGRCARHGDGAVSCWGDCAGGECAAATPVRIVGLAHAHAIASNRSYSCAITGPDRQVQCWGLPEPERTRWESERPRSAASLQTVVTLKEMRAMRQLELGERFGVAVSDEGSLYHWGAIHLGDLYAFDGEPAPMERPHYLGNLNPRYVGVGIHDLDLAVNQIGENLKVKNTLVTGYYVCLELERGGLRCEPSLERAPFRIAEVWPAVSFEAGDEP
jgi:hypothetical protein